MALPEDARAEPPSTGQLLALVDSLHEGTLNETQAETIRQLRAGSWPWQNEKALYRMLRFQPSRIDAS